MTGWEADALPHGAVEPLASNVWQVTGSLKRSPLPRNMLVWRYAQDALLLHSPICLDAEGMTALERLGAITHVIIPCPMHRYDAARFRERFPEALFLCPEFMREKHALRLGIDMSCEEGLPELGVQICAPAGLKHFELHYLLPLGDQSRALVMTDALFNLGDDPPKGFGGWIMKCAGSVGPLGITKLGRRLLLEDKQAFRTYLSELAAMESIQVLSVAHGGAICGDVSAALQFASERV